MGSLMEYLTSCIWFEGGDKRNALASFVSGTLFFTGWWLIIDANVTHSDVFHGAYHICGVAGTISLFMINVVSNSQTQNELYSGGCMGPRGARLWLFIGFVCGFAAVIASCWIFFSDFAGHVTNPKWIGVALLLQNVFILVGSLIFKFGRVEDPWG
ncbi:transmembrane protein 50A [Cimex lectularius]|uniref:Transmembrane protein 50A n=1 Tax=Cimex lectularius TaxID=79782 RepID=A0A8I6S9N7_CIMLE|nr:transmembrane protein 50A [Cimex lectularius]